LFECSKKSASFNGSGRIEFDARSFPTDSSMIQSNNNFTSFSFEFAASEPNAGLLNANTKVIMSIITCQCDALCTMLTRCNKRSPNIIMQSGTDSGGRRGWMTSLPEPYWESQ